MQSPIVTLTSDFGLIDPYVAEMKAAILRHAPFARLIDVTHSISAQDILGASISLHRVLAAFEPKTIHLTVVDPGVGTKRKLLVVKINHQIVVCPDNGLITWAWRHWPDATAFELFWRPKILSNTFHGRDILAPAAGKLAMGKPLKSLAKPSAVPILLDIYPVRPGAKIGSIIHIDHFGNAMTNFPAELLTEKYRKIRVRGKSLPIQATYGDFSPGQALALIGSSGYLEIAVRNGSAAKKLGLRTGDAVTI